MAISGIKILFWMLLLVIWELRAIIVDSYCTCILSFCRDVPWKVVYGEVEILVIIILKYQ